MPSQIKAIWRTDAGSPLPIWMPSVTLSSYNQLSPFCHGSNDDLRKYLFGK